MSDVSPTVSAGAPDHVPMPVAAIGSGLIHLLLLVLLWIPGGSLALSAGEDGYLGAGGPVVQIEVVGATGPAPLVGPGALPIEAAPRADDAPETSEASVTAPELTEPAATATHALTEPETSEPADRAVRPAASAAPSSAAAAATTAQTPGAGDAEQSTPGLLPGSGTGAASDSSGRAAGESRAVAAILGSIGLVPEGSTSVRGALEDAIRCSDPIEGRWMAHRYRPGARDWVRMELRIHRDGESIRGEIRARTWAGMTTDRVPPPCVPGGRDVTMRMEASGSFRGHRIDFGSRRADLLRADCPDHSHIYYPDHFTGTLAPDGETLNTTNNDGHVDIDFPYRFQRVSCTPNE